MPNQTWTNCIVYKRYLNKLEDYGLKGALWNEGLLKITIQKSYFIFAGLHVSVGSQEDAWNKVH